LDLDQGKPLDPHVGSRIGALQEKAREFGRRDREIARSDTPTAGHSGGHSRVGKWNTGGTKPRDLAARSLEILVLGFTSLEAPRAFELGPTRVSGEFKAVRSLRDTWCAIGLHRLFAPRDFREEELALPSRET
jgi:hypothetical protein